MPQYIYGLQQVLFGARQVVGFGCDEFFVKLVDRGLANYLIQINHYSKKFVQSSKINFGIFSENEILGILQYGPSMNPASHASIVAGSKFDEYLELNRMWLSDILPRNSETRALSYSIKVLRVIRPRLKWIQSFADERCGLFGTVYQAANFGYYGEHTSVFWELDGETYHNSLMTRTNITTPKSRWLQENKDRARSYKYRQFRYVYFLKIRFAKNCLLKKQDFPKNPRSV